MPGRVFNTLVNLTDTFILPKPPPAPVEPTPSSLSALSTNSTLKDQIYDSSGNFKLKIVDVSGVVLSTQELQQVEAYNAYVKSVQTYLQSVQNQLLITPPTPEKGSPVIHTVYIKDAARSQWNTTDFLLHVANDFSTRWNASETPLRRYADSSGFASTALYRLPYKGAKAENSFVTRFSQFVTCELGTSVVISPTLLTQTFIESLMSAMLNKQTNTPTEMGANAFAQFMNADVGDKTNIIIRDVFLDSGVKISPYSAVNPTVLGDFITEIVVVH
jgi:hypothetical protein